MATPTPRPAAPRRPVIRLLFLRTGTGTVAACLRELRQVDIDARADVARTLEEFADQLLSEAHALVLAEYPNAIYPGTEILEGIRRFRTDRHIPVVFIARRPGRETVAALMSKGVGDCVDAEHLGHLPVVIRRVLSESQLREQRDRARQQLGLADAHYPAVAGHMNCGICLCKLDGTLLDVNPALMAMLGYSSRRDLLARSLAGAILRDPQQRAQLLRHVPYSNPIETEWTRKDGTTLRVRLIGRLVNGDDGRPHTYELIAEDITRQRELDDSRRQQVARDALTGLPNYRQLAQVLDTEIKRSARTGREFALLLLDVDKFKAFNDDHGYGAGSQALRRVAEVLAIFSRETDTAARVGGDEFALVMPETRLDGARHVANRIQDRLARDTRARISVSIGLAAYPRDGERVDSLLAAAGRSMSAKHPAAQFQRVRCNQT